MPRSLVFIIIVGLFFLSSSMSGGNVGVSSVCVNNECEIVASSSLTSLFLGVCLGIFIFLFPRKDSILNTTKVVGLWRRFGAFFLDFMSVLLVFTPVTVIPILIAEANVTGEYQWSFARDFARPSDNLYILPSVFTVFIVMYIYFLFYARSNKQTVGQYVLNYKVSASVVDDEKPKYGLRVLYSFIGLCAWPVSVILALRKPDKACWWDICTNTKVVRINAVNKSLQPTAESSV
jgi:uncharacterized RDD family membrane protein YckC